MPWAVRGEVPLDEENSACGCTTIVFGGVRMQMPEKIFGASWLELRHPTLQVAFCFDCAGALQRCGTCRSSPTAASRPPS